ncbi:hypothetical protein MUP46_00795 [Patescibacteria group bacterium]|nr:hypothetical protein [Patescibacteria group bacterium]
MRIIKDILRNHRIFNSWDIARTAKNKLFISYSSAELGRASRPAHWQVVGMGIVTDRDAHWMNYGNKTFTVYNREEKNPKLQEAIQWVKTTYNIDMADKDPFGAYHPAGTIAKLQELIANKGDN